MPIRADIVGFTQEIEHLVSARWALAYGASLGWDDLLDDADPAGLFIPPSFCVCPEWALVGSDERAARLGVTPEERRRNVHAAQDSSFHAPFRAGMRLRTVSTIVQARETSAGALIVTRLDSTDAASGEAIVTSHTTAIMRGVGFAAPPLSPAVALPEAFLPGEPAGAAIAIPTHRGMPHTYSEAARIWNPIHTERRVALAVGLPDIILHGTITWALCARAVAPDLRAVRRIAGRFRGAVVPGEVISVLGDGGGGFTGRGGAGVVCEGRVFFF